MAPGKLILPTAFAEMTTDTIVVPTIAKRTVKPPVKPGAKYRELGA